MYVKLYVMAVTGEEEEISCQPGYYKFIINGMTQVCGETNLDKSSNWKYILKVWSKESSLFDLA